ncbi:MAG: hypothetical protein R3F43_12055 [bacterium]
MARRCNPLFPSPERRNNKRFHPKEVPHEVHQPVHLTAGIAFSLSLTACGTTDEGTDDLGSRPDRSPRPSRRRCGEHAPDQEDRDAAAADEEAGAELGDEADEAPWPRRAHRRLLQRSLGRGPRPAARPASPRAASCPSRPRAATTSPSTLAECAPRRPARCHRMEEHNGACRDRPAPPARPCADEWGDRETCRQAALDAGRACMEASPDRPQRPEGEERTAPERLQPRPARGRRPPRAPAAPGR